MHAFFMEEDSSQDNNLYCKSYAIRAKYNSFKFKRINVISGTAIENIQEFLPLVASINLYYGSNIHYSQLEKEIAKICDNWKYPWTCITTHSWEVLEYFAKYVNKQDKDWQNDFQYINFTHNKKCLLNESYSIPKNMYHATHYNFEEFSRAINHNIEIR